VDGVLDGTAAFTTTASPLTNTQPLAIGNAGVAGTSFFNGVIDETRVWNRPLGPDEVLAYADATSGMQVLSPPAAVAGQCHSGQWRHAAIRCHRHLHQQNHPGHCVECDVVFIECGSGNHQFRGPCNRRWVWQIDHQGYRGSHLRIGNAHGAGPDSSVHCLDSYRSNCPQRHRRNVCCHRRL
jgi:hypothetical protein